MTSTLTKIDEQSEKIASTRPASRATVSSSDSDEANSFFNKRRSLDVFQIFCESSGRANSRLPTSLWKRYDDQTATMRARPGLSLDNSQSLLANSFDSRSTTDSQKTTIDEERSHSFRFNVKASLAAFRRKANSLDDEDRQSLRGGTPLTLNYNGSFRLAKIEEKVESAAAEPGSPATARLYRKTAARLASPLQPAKPDVSETRSSGSPVPDSTGFSGLIKSVFSKPGTSSTGRPSPASTQAPYVTSPSTSGQMNASAKRDIGRRETPVGLGLSNVQFPASFLSRGAKTGHSKSRSMSGSSDGSNIFYFGHADRRAQSKYPGNLPSPVSSTFQMVSPPVLRSLSISRQETTPDRGSSTKKWPAGEPQLIVQERPSTSSNRPVLSPSRFRMYDEDVAPKYSVLRSKGTIFGDLNLKLRDELGLPPRIVSLEKTPTSHPNHPFTWTSANMWCYSCSGECHSCRRPCCAFYQQLSIAFGNTTTVTEKMAAEQMIRKIIALNPSGPDIAGTFLPCSSCSKTLCPDCCGICPDIMCRDVQCRNCKSDPWAECDWH